LTFPKRWQYNISERERVLDHMTPGIFVVPSIISTKPVKLETSNLVHIFVLALPTRMDIDILEMSHGPGHVTPVKFSIISSISVNPYKYISKRCEIAKI